MYLLGIDIGTSSVKSAIFDSQSLRCIASASFPETEMPIKSPKAGWAEQSPTDWWHHTTQAILKLNDLKVYNPKDIKAIGIAYQMHGLVVIDKDRNALRDSIIWCDGRSVDIGNKAFEAIGQEWCLGRLLNSPGNFTASKLAWVQQNEPKLYQQIYKAMLPGDFIAMKLTDHITTTPSALSEGIFWDFQANAISDEVLSYFKIDRQLLPEVKPVFSEHGVLSKKIADILGLSAGIPVSYKAGDQLNNALSLNVLRPGEVAATAGTSGVIFGVGNAISCDKRSRINSFAHVNHSRKNTSIGTLLCINGTGSAYRWARANFAPKIGYDALNELAETAPIGSKNLAFLPFGNGAERMLSNRFVDAQFLNIDFNLHDSSHIFRALQEGIGFAFRYGLDIMRGNGLNPNVVRAGNANLFKSKLFAQLFADVTGLALELYENDGSVGAAIGAGIGSGIFEAPEQAFKNMKKQRVVEPVSSREYEPFYQKWELNLNKT